MQVESGFCSPEIKLRRQALLFRGVGFGRRHISLVGSFKPRCLDSERVWLYDALMVWIKGWGS